jgi:hypothetical protein
MHLEDLKFYKDGEDVAVDLMLKAFGSDEVQCINLEYESPDQKIAILSGEWQTKPFA